MMSPGLLIEEKGPKIYENSKYQTKNKKNGILIFSKIKTMQLQEL